MNVAFQGEPGAYSEAAVLQLYPASTPQPYEQFKAVFHAVTTGQADAGVIPIENSLFGSVHINYDHLRTHAAHICRGQFMRIRHCLMAPKGASFDTIRTVRSHPQALGQCRQYLQTTLPHADAEPAYDTAGAAQAVAQSNDCSQAAIASAQAAAHYDLHVLATEIEDDAGNYTRFLGIETGDAETHVTDTANRTSLVFGLRDNVPGALFKSLAVFALRDLDLLKMESRPQFGSPGQYLFYVDIAGSYADASVRRALTHLQEITTEQKLLGSYYEAPIPE